jgi:hypothetical protein
MVESLMKNIPTYFMDVDSKLERLGGVLLDKNNFATLQSVHQKIEFPFATNDYRNIKDAFARIISNEE